MFPTPNCFDRDRKCRHTDRYRSLNKQEAEQRAVRRASDWASQIDSLTSIKAGSYLGSGQVAAAATGACSPSPTSWLLDSGSGFDLVGKDEIDTDRLPPKRQLKTPLEVETANGPVDIREEVPDQVGPLGTSVWATIMKKCPAVLSLGKCVILDR